MDMSLNGNHVLKCPNCGHEHCRVVVDGQITDDRWDSRNGAPPVFATNISSSSTSTFSTYVTSSGNGGSMTTGSIFLYQSWLSTAAAN